MRDNFTNKSNQSITTHGTEVWLLDIKTTNQINVEETIY